MLGGGAQEELFGQVSTTTSLSFIMNMLSHILELL